MWRFPLCFVVAALICPAPAQAKGLPCDVPQYTVLEKGKSLTVDCEFVLVMNDKQVARVTARDETAAQLLDRLSTRAELFNRIVASQDQVIAELKGLVASQSTRFEELRQQYERTDALAKASTRNTDEALSLAKRSRYAGWVSAALVGGVGGGVVGLQQKASGGRTAAFAGVGALAGLLIAYGINH